MSGKEAQGMGDQKRTISKITASANELLESIEDLESVDEVSEVNEQILDFFSIANRTASQLSGDSASKVESIITRVDKRIARKAKQLKLDYSKSNARGSADVRVLSAQSATKEHPSAGAGGAYQPSATAAPQMRQEGMTAQTPAQDLAYRARSSVASSIKHELWEVHTRLEESLEEKTGEMRDTLKGTKAGSNLERLDRLFQDRRTSYYQSILKHSMGIIYSAPGDVAVIAEGLRNIIAMEYQGMNRIISDREFGIAKAIAMTGNDAELSKELGAVNGRTISQIEDLQTKAEAAFEELFNGLKKNPPSAPAPAAAPEFKVQAKAPANVEVPLEVRRNQVMRWTNIIGNYALYAEVVRFHPDLAVERIRDQQSMTALSNYLWEAYLSATDPTKGKSQLNAFIAAEKANDIARMTQIKNEAVRNFFRYHDQQKDGFTLNALVGNKMLKLTMGEEMALKEFTSGKMEGYSWLVQQAYEKYLDVLTNPQPLPVPPAPPRNITRAEWDEDAE
ncbi:MAG: hypothetical protein LVQ95_04180 [Candidatus Micrarchaeales archaeon]|nr:hypothetical protein [Candidatus Micrarchaeales archaeon]